MQQAIKWEQLRHLQLMEPPLIGKIEPTLRIKFSYKDSIQATTIKIRSNQVKKNYHNKLYMQE